MANPAVPTTYTFRLWGVDTTCYNDTTLVLPPSVCSLSIGDYIWFDNNKDGIQDLNENGVKNIEVKLYPNGTCSGGTYTTTYTTEFGLYEFTGLTSGNYCIRVTAPTDWSLSPAGVGSDPTRNSKGQTTTTAGVYSIQNIVLGSTNDYTLDLGLYANCVPVNLSAGTTATLNQNVTYSHTNAYDIEISNLKGTGYCLEKSNLDPIDGDQLTVNTTDRNGVSVAYQGYISRALAALGDPSVLSVVLSNFGAGDNSATRGLDDVMQLVVWYYTNWNENFTNVELSINDRAWTALQKSSMIALAHTIINRAQGLNGETQYPIVQTYYLYNQTNSGRQDLIISVGSLLPLSTCTCTPPTITSVFSQQATCTSGIANSNAAVAVRGIAGMAKYAYRTNATDSLWANTATPSTADSIRISNIANPEVATTYTFRLWGIDTTCYNDTTVVLNPSVCPQIVNLTLSKTVDSSSVSAAGRTVNFTLKVKNISAVNATGVTVKVTAGTGFTYVSTTPSGVYNSGTGIWTVGAVNAGDSATLVLTVKADSIGVNYCAAEINAADQTDSNSTPNNAVATEDDIARACVSVPMPLCPNQTYQAALPNGLTGIQWYKNGSPISGETNQVLTITEVGEYTFTANESNCPVEGCCPIKVVTGTCTLPCKPVICLPVSVVRQ